MIRLSAVAGVAIGLADYAVARRRTEKQIRMTKHEVKQEAKQTDGDPHMQAGDPRPADPDVPQPDDGRHRRRPTWSS